MKKLNSTVPEPETFIREIHSFSGSFNPTFQKNWFASMAEIEGLELHHFIVMVDSELGVCDICWSANTISGTAMVDPYDYLFCFFTTNFDLDGFSLLLNGNVETILSESTPICKDCCSEYMMENKNIERAFTEFNIKLS